MNSSLRIAVVANVNSIHTTRWVNWLNDRGHQVQIFSLNEGENCTYFGTEPALNRSLIFNLGSAVRRTTKKLQSEILATVKFDKEVKNINLLNEFPNVSFIEVRSYLQKISNLLNKIYLSISLVSLVVIFIGFFVIVSAIIVQGKSKIYQNLVFKINVLSKLQIIKSSIIEFLILYGVTIFFSTIFSIIISNLAIQGFFNLSWEFDFNTFFIIISFIMVLSLLLIFFTNFKYLTPKIYPLIRNE